MFFRRAMTCFTVYCLMPVLYPDRINYLMTILFAATCRTGIIYSKVPEFIYRSPLYHPYCPNDSGTTKDLTRIKTIITRDNNVKALFKCGCITYHLSII